MQMRFWRDGLVGAALTCMSLGILGCSGERTARLSGRVTYQDKAVSGGTVVFTDEKTTKIERVRTDSDGNYKADVPYGQLHVGVEPAPKPPTAVMPKGVKANIPKDAPNYGGESTGTYVDIPKVLRDPTTSKITVTVDSAEKKFDISLPMK